MIDGVPWLTIGEALGIARRWDFGATEVEPLRAGENDTWRVNSGGKWYVLRLTSAAHRTKAQIEGELAFVDHVSAGGLHVARALRTADGVQVLDVSTVISNEPTYATLFEWLPGRHFAYRSPDIDRPLFRLWGATMARLHQLSSTFVARPEVGRPEWHDDPVAGCALRDVARPAAIVALRHELVGWMRDMPPEPAHYGMVHGDFERTNFVLDAARIGLFDFDDCCRHWFCWDIACALWVFRNDSPANRARFLAWFMEGYAGVREPDVRRLERFSDLIRLRTVALLLRQLRHPTRFASAADRTWNERTETWLGSSWHW